MDSVRPAPYADKQYNELCQQSGVESEGRLSRPYHAVGDICNDMQNKDYAEIGIFDTAAQLSGGTVPCVYTRGNHETRGEFSGYLLQYLPSDTGEFYFTFEYGPMSSVVLDFGEDKIDTHPEYSGLVDYNNYRIEENDWLGTVQSYGGEPTYRIAFCHGPNIINHFGFNWLQPVRHGERIWLSAGTITALKCGSRAAKTRTAAPIFRLCWTVRMSTVQGLTQASFC